jgi:hypothetical protein
MDMVPIMNNSHLKTILKAWVELISLCTAHKNSKILLVVIYIPNIIHIKDFQSTETNILFVIIMKYNKLYLWILCRVHKMNT